MKHPPREEPDDSDLDDAASEAYQQMIQGDGGEEPCDLCKLVPDDGSLKRCRLCYRYVCGDCFGSYGRCVDCAEA